ncbi:putative gibberellin 20 oxidase [Massariosphaeria phaeospora]|uniref:Putative gibberellin 20 oxidase n=1 Tax=Massariosphaeria phaeospora TaxID=100035 RepID=A0A7C8MCP5_9PLEO|nr:putative gibberellin 20 oxidase [Massariosphaeria phaeospora]
MVTIPVINVSGYLVGDPKATAACAAALRDACENQGFLQVVGHSVPEITQKNFLYAITRFFALLQDEKETLSQDNSPCHRGYERIGGQKLDELNADATPDQKEGFSIRPERPLGKFLAGPNQWPDENRVPGFKEAYMEYFWAVHSLSKAIFQLMALSLGLDRTCFDAFAADPDGICLCRAHHYNPTPKDAAGRTRGVGAHTDFGAITLLLQDTIGGLEVLRKPTGTWHPVPPIEGAYVCNIGDLMQRWTNDRYRSTMHRVISPLSQTDRYSCAFFNDGALDMIIEPLPTCIPEGESPAYEPLKVETHILQRYQQSYGAGGTHIKRKA